MKLGELYEKWQKKTNKSIGRVGVFDDETEDPGLEDATKHGRKASGGKKKSNVKNNVDDERKTVTAIRKEREKKEDMRIKNMKKGDRRQFERKRIENKTSTPGDSGSKKAGVKSKKGGPNSRWSGSNKKGGKR
jgi:hypothetical protein